MKLSPFCSVEILFSFMLFRVNLDVLVTYVPSSKRLRSDNESQKWKDNCCSLQKLFNAPRVLGTVAIVYSANRCWKQRVRDIHENVVSSKFILYVNNIIMVKLSVKLWNACIVSVTGVQSSILQSNMWMIAICFTYFVLYSSVNLTQLSILFPYFFSSFPDCVFFGAITALV